MRHGRHDTSTAAGGGIDGTVAVLDEQDLADLPAWGAVVDPAADDAEPAVEPEPAVDPDVIVLPPLRGPLVRRGRTIRRAPMSILRPGSPTTTRQAEVLNTALIGSPTDERGVVIGVDRISAGMVAHDPFTAYEAGLITSPNVAILGMIGMGKSALVKTVYVERPLLLRNRRAVVVDKKLRDGEGEYAELTRMFGAEPFRFIAGNDGRGERSTCMNLLDPVILAGGGPARQVDLLNAIGELAGDGALNEWDHKALRVAYQRVMTTFEDARRIPVMPDLIDAFAGVVDDPEFHRVRPATLDQIEAAAWSVRFRFERLLGDDLAGMFDRETSPHVQLHPKLTTFDISSLPEDGPATSMVMLVANAWLTGILTRHPGLRTNFVAEEGWHLLAGPGGRVIRSKSKLSRGLGLSIVAAIHHVSDIPEGSDAVAMLKEAQTIHLYRQEHEDDIVDCVRYFGLEASNAEALSTLPQGDHLLKVGVQKEIRVQHIRGQLETSFTETDAAMVSQPAGARR